MTVNKLERFAQISQFNHVFEYTDYRHNDVSKPKGKWQEHIFENTRPITLELACGTGAYTLELARRYPDQNYIGIDIKGARIWKGAKRAKKEGLENVRFVRMFIDHLHEYFAPGEVSEIWVTFPDPFPKTSDRSKRLSSPGFLRIYRQILKPGASIHFKTDDASYFDYTCRMIQKAGGTIRKKVVDIYGEHPENEVLTIQTVYEKRHLKNDKIISYANFVLS